MTNRNKPGKSKGELRLAFLIQNELQIDFSDRMTMKFDDLDK